MKYKKLIICALFTALNAIFSQISIPIGPIPINLATLSVLCSATLLGPGLGALSQIIYLLLGAFGLPVFSFMKGGLGVLAGPTGGYIVGYVLAAFVTGFIIQKFKFNIRIILLALCSGYITYTALGTIWYIYSANVNILQAILVCVLPFIVGDALKIAAACLLTIRLRPIILKMYP